MSKIKRSDEDELIIARQELAFQREEKGKLVEELSIARKEGIGKSAVVGLVERKSMCFDKINFSNR